MIQLIAKRLVAMVVVLLVFDCGNFRPPETLTDQSGPRVPRSERLSRRRSDREPKCSATTGRSWCQYFRYVDGLVHGNLGVSLRTRRPVATDLADYLPATLELASFGLLLSVISGQHLSACCPRRGPEVAAIFRLIMLVGASTPPFLLALFGIIVFYHDLNWLPATGRTSLANPPTGPTPS